VLRRGSIVVALVAALAGCGGGSDDRTSTATGGATPEAAAYGASFKHDANRDAQGVEGQSVCALLPAAQVGALTGVSRLRGHVNDSTDLSICSYRGPRGANVRVLLDGASEATRRYYYQLTEARELHHFFNDDPSFKPRDVTGVGDDRTYGGAGAYWTPARAQLVAFADERIVRVTVHVAGQADARRKRESAALAKALFGVLPAAQQDG
jgi:hypothetical protein